MFVRDVDVDGEKYSAGSPVPDDFPWMVLVRAVKVGFVTLDDKPRKEKKAKKHKSFADVVNALLHRKKNPLTQEQIDALVAEIKAGGGQKELAKKYGVSFGTLKELTNGESVRDGVQPNPDSTQTQTANSATGGTESSSAESGDSA